MTTISLAQPRDGQVSGAQPWYDKMVVLWLLPPLGFVVTILKDPFFNHLVGYYTLTALLLCVIGHRLFIRRYQRSTILYLVAALAFIGLFAAVELVHFALGQMTIDGVTDIRMIIYSSLYGTSIVFVLYCVYLTLLNPQERIDHLRFAVKYLTVFNCAFLTYWFFLRTGRISPIDGANLLQSNGISYAALFAVSVLLLYRKQLAVRLNHLALMLVPNCLAIAVNDSRGALLCLLILIAALIARSLSRRFGAGMVAVLAVSSVTLLFSASFLSSALLDTVFGTDLDKTGMLIDHVIFAYENNLSDVMLDRTIVADENTISFLSRIGSLLYTSLVFFDHLLLGVGQSETYSIVVMGSSIHTLPSLIALSTGVVGLLAFSGAVVMVLLAQGVRRLTFEFLLLMGLMFGLVLILNNSVPAYFAMIITILAGIDQRPQASKTSAAGDL